MKGERDVNAVVRSVVESVGLELWDVAYRREAGRMVLRVAVTRVGGVDLDTITQTSEKLSRRLDLEDFGEGRYELEVGSPGLERALKEPRHFHRSIGEQVRVKTVEPIEGSKVHRGALVSADAEAITIATDGGELRVPYDAVASARTVFEWGSDRS
jgi:ribosome maturation factor RimP